MNEHDQSRPGKVTAALLARIDAYLGPGFLSGAIATDVDELTRFRRTMSVSCWLGSTLNRGDQFDGPPAVVHRLPRLHPGPRPSARPSA